MPDVIVQSSRPASRLAAWPVLLAGAITIALIGATLALWAHYGAAVFFEIIAAGIAACF